MTKTVTLELNIKQIGLLLGVLYEYERQIGYETDEEKEIHSIVENMLEDAENEVFTNV